MCKSLPVPGSHGFQQAYSLDELYKELIKDAIFFKTTGGGLL